MLKAVLLVVATTLLLAAGVSAIVKAAAYSGYARSIGTVVAFRGVTPPPAQKGPQPEPEVAAVIEFTDAAGTGHRIVGGWSSRTPQHALGDRVPVLYPATDPARGVIDSFAEKWGLPLVSGAAATVSLLLAYVVRGARLR